MNCTSCKKLYIETLGCAMNERDSQHMISELAKSGYEITLDPKTADLILINTCSVREKPERKLFSEIGAFAKIKKPGAKIGVTGCTASHMGEEILQKSPHVNFVLGARNISKIREIIHRDRAVEVALDFDDSTYVFDTAPDPKNGVKALLNISIGCDKKCAYCIVPHTRGREISIPLELLMNEAQRLAQNGIKELLLLGQNVNNYGVRFSVPHEKMNFSKLLRALSNVNGIERLRFTSPHPLHMDDEFIEEFASNPKICKQIHVPLQSGSTQILKSMRRGYSKEWYLRVIEKIREKVPHVGLSTDIIVGFPGENEADFMHSMDVVERVRFDTMYSFIYSPRPHTEAADFASEMTVPREIASDRLTRLQNLHRQILKNKAKEEINRKHFVLIENAKTTGETRFSEGRSDNGRLIKIDEILPLGRICEVIVTRNEGGSLWGKSL